MHPHDLAGYLAAQLAGALIGGRHMAPGLGADSRKLDGRRDRAWARRASLAAMAIEAVTTAVLVLTIFFFVSRPKLMRWPPLAVWLVVTLLVWQGALLTGTSLNPARSLGPAVIHGSYLSIWIYFAGPVMGAAVAAVLVHVLGARLRPLTATIFHDPRYPTVFRAARPMPMGSEPA